MNKCVKALWAKKNENNGKFYWLPLITHLQDTMDVAQYLYNHWISEGQRSYLKSQIILNDLKVDDDIMESLVLFLGGIHDIGKATPAFQTQKSFSASADLDRFILENLEKSGFTGICDLILASAKKSHHTIAGEEILHSYGLNYDITSIIGAHHGKPADDIFTYDHQTAYPANYYQSEDVNSEIATRWKKAQRDIYNWILEVSGMDQYGFPEISQPAQVILTGLIIMADWISSNTYYFPLMELSDENSKADLNDDESEERFVTGIKKWFRNLPFDINQPDNCEQLFIDRFTFFPRDFQTEIFELVKAIKNPGIIVIEAPMGCGKTEAALAAAEQLAAKTKSSGLFFGLPTQATSNGIFPRIESWVESLSKEYGKTSVRLVHGKAALNKQMQDLRERTASSVDNDSKDGTVIINEWFSGRKTASLDDFVVGTVDQFLLMALKQKHLMLRHLGFSKKVVVIDEVHAYDVYMQQYLQEALCWCGAYHVPVILLSATLPSKTRFSLIHSYMKGRGLKSAYLKKRENELVNNAYPLVTYTDADEIKQKIISSTESQKEVYLRNLAENNLYDVLADLIHDGGIIGIIVNTVKRAQLIALKCIDYFGEENIEIIHSHFIATDRLEKEKRITEMIGKGAKRPFMKIIIGTQVLEQSLDIDFDVLITDLCPMDLLIQRIGRLHRHNIKRPEKHKNAVTYILGLSDSFEFEEGSSAIYSEYLLAKTEMNLPEKISIPEDIPKLVSSVYDDEKEPIISDDLRKEYEKFKSENETSLLKKKDKAKAFKLNNPKLRVRPEKNNLIGWLNTESVADSEEKAYAQVRDTVETVEIIAVRKCKDGYSTFASDVDLSLRIDESDIGRQLAQHTLRLPTVLTAYGKADQVINDLEKYNLKYLPEWQSNIWLKGCLGIIFDENGSAMIRDKVLQYDQFLGLRIKGDED